MKVVILCGGQGTRIRDVSSLVPKPMIEVGEMPILWHIMKSYATHGFNEFVLCLGYKGHTIKEFFFNYDMLTNDFTIQLGANETEIHRSHSEVGWKVTLADTGLNSMTGARLKKASKYIDSDIFMLTYGDGVCDIDLNKLVEFHKSHGKIGTVTGVCPPSRYGELVIDKGAVTSFCEKPEDVGGQINGGYFVFNKEFLNYLDDSDDLILERAPLERLVADGQMQVFEHKGFWQCMDTQRDYNFLNNLWLKNQAPWKKW